jgi:signal transduction histidine kinase
MFLVSLAAATYGLVAEKQLAIAFAKKELVGTRYLTTVRDIFVQILTAAPIYVLDDQRGSLRTDPVQTLTAAQAGAGAAMQTGQAADSLADALKLWMANRDSIAGLVLAQDALAKARQLVARIADSSNLALDPDLDSYHVQDLITRKLPVLLRQLSELQILSLSISARPISAEQKARFQIMEGLLQSIAEEIRENLEAAYLGNSDGSLKRAVDAAFANLMSHINAYLRAMGESFADSHPAAAAQESARVYGQVVESSVAAWHAAQNELDRLLQARITGLLRNLIVSLAAIGALAGLSIVIAAMTHRHIVQPLERLESIASTVRKTKDYSLRTKHVSADEIGRLSTAFNDMLTELAAARERERAEQTELMKVARLTTMGAMTASIAHEINQPLTAIVANSSAAHRWLSNAQPDLDEARKALKNITNDGHRASKVIDSVRAMFRKDSREKVPLAVNDVIEDILPIVYGEIRKHGVRLQTELSRNMPDVFGDRIQLLQVFMNLIRNAVEAMSSVTDREKLLVVKSQVFEPGAVRISVQDSGQGIDPGDMERIFAAFHTTKADGMGMGLSICRSIVEAHGGRLWASAAPSHGSIFYVTLPSREP